MYRLLTVSDVVMRVQTQGRTTRRSTQSRANGQNWKVSDDAYARRLVRTTREAYAQRLRDAGKPLPAITREALEKQREEQKRELRREKRVEQDLSKASSKALVKHTTS
ncbi:hypothetical protein PC120_g23063 [Phytophthora cactorum]|nr:hypothetical protein PC120_g23063 [Phytophthora cactorum]